MPLIRPGKNKGRLTLSHEKVKEFLKFRSTFFSERPEGEKTQDEYAKNHNISPQALHDNYLSIPGFSEEVSKIKAEKLILAAENGFKVLADGATEIIKGPRGVTIIKKAPDTAACKAIYEIFGGFKPNADVDRLLGEIAKAIK